MSQIINVNDYRANKKSTGLSVILSVSNDDCYPRLGDEYLATFTDAKSLEQAINEILPKFGTLSDQIETGFSLETANEITVVASTSSRMHLISLNYRFSVDSSELRANIQIKIYTYGLTAQTNQEIVNYLAEVALYNN